MCLKFHNMNPWCFLACQLDQRVSILVYLPVRVVIERTFALEIARMSAFLASLDCGEKDSDSEEDEAGEMHDGKFDMIPEL